MNLYTYHTNPETLYGFEKAIRTAGLFYDDDIIEIGFNSKSAREMLANSYPEKYSKASWTGYLPFVSDELLNNLLSDMKDNCLEMVDEHISQWEIDDEYYYQYLRDEGFVDEDGEVAWENAPPYSEYNDDVRQWYNELDDAFDVSLDELLEVGREKDEEELDGYDEIFQPSTYDLVYLEELIAFMLKKDLHGNDRYYDTSDYAKRYIADYLEKHIEVKQVLTGELGNRKAVIENGQKMYEVKYIPTGRYT